MPEGHIIHGLARDLNQVFGACPVFASSPQGRFSQEAALVNGRELIASEAYGKHLFIDFDAPDPGTIHIHLGLIGKLRINPLAPPVGIVRLRLNDEATAADLHGPQWCRLISQGERAAVVAALGPDPLRSDADPERGWVKVHRSAKPVAALLMDQTIAAGVGNIYRAEVLFRQRIDPMTPGNALKHATWQAIWEDLVALMARGAISGEIDTVHPEHEPGAMGRLARKDAHGGEVYVYRRAGQHCLVCGSEVRLADLAGRNLYWCQRCQRRHM